MSKREPRRQRRRAASARATASRDTRVYVPVVHGIGTPSGEYWAKESVGALVAWWKGTDRDVAAIELDCPAGGRCGLSPDHRHLSLVRGERTARVDLDPIYWGDKVESLGRWRCASSALQVGLLIFLVDLFAAAAPRVRAVGHATESESFFVFSWALIRAVPTLCAVMARAMIVPPLTLVATVVVWCSRRVRRRVSDGLAFGADPRARAAVLDHVRARVRQGAGADTVVLIGHSQGGSILAEIEPGLCREQRRVRLVTLGTGHALLAAVDKLRPRWPLWRSVVLATLVVAWSILIAAWLIPFGLRGLYGAAHGLVDVLRFGAAFWTGGMAPDYAVSLVQRAAGEVTAADMTALQNNSNDGATMVAGLQAGMVGVLVLGVAAALIGDRPRELRRAIETKAEGLDIIATHDPVSAAMRELGAQGRLWRVHQCASLVRDHTSYFKNACSVLPLVAAEVETAGGLGAVEHEPALRAAPHAAGLTMRRWTHAGIVMFCVPVFAGAVVGGGGGYGALVIMAVFAVVLASALAGRTSRG